MLGKRIIRNRWLYCMLVPGLIYFAVFKYAPMYGVVIAFQNYIPFLGISGSEWVGFQHFDRFFSDAIFWKLFRNTLMIAVYNIFFFFPLPIIIALLLNEIRRETLKRVVQSLIYIPHFVSWVVVAGISYLLFTTEGGTVNNLVASLGLKKIPFLLSEDWFRTMITSQVIWKETGWGTIIILAALVGVDTQLYEAARMDGANRWKQLWHVTLPSISNTIAILLILRLGSFLETGFEQIYLMLNALNREVGEVFDTYVFGIGIEQGQYSFATAVGLFQSVVGLILIASANWSAKKIGKEGVL